jgi:hypothetical protein
MNLRPVNAEFLTIARGLSLDKAQEWFFTGRLTQRQFDRFCALWGWSAERLTGTAGANQDSFLRLHGTDEFHARINRTRRACGYPEIAYAN